MRLTARVAARDTARVEGSMTKGKIYAAILDADNGDYPLNVVCEAARRYADGLPDFAKEELAAKELVKHMGPDWFIRGDAILNGHNGLAVRVKDAPMFLEIIERAIATNEDSA